MKKLSNLLLEWTTAIIEINSNAIKEYLLKEPELLWTPIPHTLDDFNELQSRLDSRLGSSFQPVCAIQFLCLTFDCFEADNMECYNLLNYLIDQSSLHDLDTRTWGDCNNSTFHLVCFLENQFIARLLFEKGVSLTISNDLGYSPKDIVSSSFSTEFAKLQQQKLARMKTVRPNYSTPNRFKLLKELAEEPTTTAEKGLQGLKNEGRYFRKGLVKESQQKVQSSDHQKDSHRKQEVDQLAKRSAVKNNPLFQQFEKNNLIITPKKQQQPKIINLLVESLREEQQQPPSPQTHTHTQQEPEQEQENEGDEEEDTQPSYHETSLYQQHEANESFYNIKQPIDYQEKDHYEEKSTPTRYYEEEEDTHSTKRETLSISHQKEQVVPIKYHEQDPVAIQYHEQEPMTFHQEKQIFPEHTYFQQDKQNDHEEKRKSRMRNSIVAPIDEKWKKRLHNSILMLSQKDDSLLSSSITEETSSSDEEGAVQAHTPVQVATRLITPAYHTGKLQVSADKNAVRPQLSELRDDKRQSGTQKASWTMSMSSWAAILDREFNLSELDHENKLKEHQRQAQEESGSSKLELSQEQMIMMNQQEIVNQLEVRNEKKKLTDTEMSDSNESKKSMEGSSSECDNRLDKKPHNDTVLSLASTLKFNEFDTPVISEPKALVQKPLKSMASVPQLNEIPKITSSRSIRRKPIASSLSEPTIRTKERSSSRPAASPQPKRPQGFGKLYLHVNGIQDILLPMPKERAYVRCVVSDGRFEYMSRYEILDQNINFDYECVIETHPDMIITVSLHVRPDYIMKSRTPFSRLFSKKKKETLSGYVNKDDGAIGQARFALAHMLPACSQIVYPAGFHCFNAWYSKSFKERHRHKKIMGVDRDVLKVVGNFDVEMLYLDKENHKVYPRSLKEYNDSIKQYQYIMEESFDSSY